MPSAQIIPLHDHRRALAVQDLARAVRHRDIAEGAMRTAEILARHAVAAGGLDQAGALGLQLALSDLRASAEELAEAHRTVEALAGGINDA